MQNSQPISNQPISNLTEAELEALIVKIIKKVITPICAFIGLMVVSQLRIDFIY